MNFQEMLKDKELEKLEEKLEESKVSDFEKGIEFAKKLFEHHKKLFENLKSKKYLN